LRQSKKQIAQRGVNIAGMSDRIKKEGVNIRRNVMQFDEPQGGQLTGMGDQFHLNGGSI
jgi:hypothetical protein